MQSGFKISNGLLPKQGPKGLRLELDFSAVTQIEFDLAKEQDLEQLDFIQAMWVENFDIAGATQRVSVLIQGIPQAITIPASSQGMFPVLCGGTFRARFTVPAVSAFKPIFTFLNVPQPYFVYLP